MNALRLQTEAFIAGLIQSRWTPRSKALTTIIMNRKRRKWNICKAFRESSRVRKAVSREAVVLTEGTGSFVRNSGEAVEPEGPYIGRVTVVGREGIVSFVTLSGEQPS